MLANWLVAKSLHDVTEQEQVICRNKIQAKVHRLRLNFRLKTLLRRPDALGVVFLSGCLYGFVGQRQSTKWTQMLTLALNLWHNKANQDDNSLP